MDMTKERLHRAFEENDDGFFASLMTVITEEMMGDDQAPEKTGRMIAEALLSNDATELLLGLTGWTPANLLGMTERKAKEAQNG